MGYSRGTLWDDELIKREILKVKQYLKIDTMPTKSQIYNATNSHSLGCAISKHGGFKKFAELLNLEFKPSESRLGEKYEILFIEHVEKMIGLTAEKMPIKFPYDILVDNSVKIDVKVSNITQCNGGYYTFNLQKKYPTCDIFACYCLNNEGDLLKVYIIPSPILRGKTQLSIGINESKYDKWLYKWETISEYANANNRICEV